MTASRTRENLAIVALSFACTFGVVWPVAAHAGVPLFAHDWTWSPYAARSVASWQLLVSSWIDVGLGEPNSAISVNPLAWLKVCLPIFLSGRDAQIAYLSLSLVILALGTYRIARRNLGVSARFAWIAVPCLLASPFVFDKIASGQSSYWSGFAAFAWGLSFALDAFEAHDARIALGSGACFALASVQLQFLAFAWIAYVVGALVDRRAGAVVIATIGIVASSTLAIPSLWFLALRGALAGAQISPPYHSWLAALSASPGDAAAMLGYVAHYAERAVGADPRVLALTHVAAYALALAAIVATVTARNKHAWTLAIVGALGWWWLTGIDGLFGRERATLVENVADASFFREFYHAGALYAIALATLGTFGLSRIGGRLRSLRIPIAIAVVAALGAQTWSGGLDRVLSFSTGYTGGDLASAVGGDEARVLFLPAREPLHTPGDAIGGNDGLDWIDARHHSLYEYYLPPLVSTAAGAIASGDAATARDLLAVFDVSAVVFRSAVVSGDPPRGNDRSLATLRSAFGPGRETMPGVTVFRVPHAPMLEGAARLVPQPANAAKMRHSAGIAYADSPGFDAGAYAVDLDRAKPDPSDGWILRRDAAASDAARIGSAFYGVYTRRPGSTVTLRDVPPGNVVAWEDGRGTYRRTVVAPEFRFVSRGAAAITEAGETTYPATRFAHAPAIETLVHDVPWEYRATVALAGRGAVVLRERFDPHWRLIAPAGVTIERHLRADGYANAWIVSGNGTVPLRFAYAYQSTASILLGVSLIAFLSTIAAARFWNRT